MNLLKWTISLVKCIGTHAMPMPPAAWDEIEGKLMDFHLNFLSVFPFISQSGQSGIWSIRVAAEWFATNKWLNHAILTRHLIPTLISDANVAINSNRFSMQMAIQFEYHLWRSLLAQRVISFEFSLFGKWWFDLFSNLILWLQMSTMILEASHWWIFVSC